MVEEEDGRGGAWYRRRAMPQYRVSFFNNLLNSNGLP